MTSVQSKIAPELHATRTMTASMTREHLMLLAQTEYARQLCKFTEAQLKKKVPCYTEQYDSIPFTMRLEIPTVNH
jgi:hypothetical protein